jgi:hypothetical protein
VEEQEEQEGVEEQAVEDRRMPLTLVDLAAVVEEEQVIQVETENAYKPSLNLVNLLIL